MQTLSSFSGNTYTLQEIAETLGVTRERARQIETMAIKKLRQPKLRKQWEEIVESLGALNNGR